MEGNEIYRLLQIELGDEIAFKVFKLFSGQQIYFSSSVLKDIRNKIIKREHNQGASYSELARRFHLTESTVRNICHPATSTHSSEPQQGTLF